MRQLRVIVLRHCTFTEYIPKSKQCRVKVVVYCISSQRLQFMKFQQNPLKSFLNYAPDKKT